MRPKVLFDSDNIWRRLEACEVVAKAYGWNSCEITNFTREVMEAFSYEEAMEIIERNFETIDGSLKWTPSLGPLGPVC
jgi:coproporphyrinogen III oxidase-like Fe-S oxidoreductase